MIATGIEAAAQQLADAAESQRRYVVKQQTAADVRTLAKAAIPPVKPDASAVAAQLKAARSFHAHGKLLALSLDVELVDVIIDLLEG